MTLNRQITINEFMENLTHQLSLLCADCICNDCLYMWSGRCPYGDCYDDKRAADDPYDAAHPDQKPRTQWSDWNKPEEQAHWCRGGSFYTTSYCEHFVKFTESAVKECLDCNVTVFQDGYISCSLVDSVGCEECYKRFEEKVKRKELV